MSLNTFLALGHKDVINVMHYFSHGIEISHSFNHKLTLFHNRGNFVMPSDLFLKRF